MSQMESLEAEGQNDLRVLTLELGSQICLISTSATY